MNLHFAGQYALSQNGKPGPGSQLHPEKPKGPLKANLENLQREAQQQGVPMTVLELGNSVMAFGKPDARGVAQALPDFRNIALIFTGQDANTASVAEAVQSLNRYEELQEALSDTMGQIRALVRKEFELNTKIKLVRTEGNGPVFFEDHGLRAYLKSALRNNGLTQLLMGPVKLSAEDGKKQSELFDQLIPQSEARDQARQTFSRQVQALADTIPKQDWHQPGAAFDAELKQDMRDFASGRTTDQ